MLYLRLIALQFFKILVFLKRVIISSNPRDMGEEVVRKEGSQDSCFAVEKCQAGNGSSMVPLSISFDSRTMPYILISR